MSPSPGQTKDFYFAFSVENYATTVNKQKHKTYTL